MPRPSSKKRKIRAKSHRVDGETRDTRKLNPPKSTEKTDDNNPAAVSPKPAGRKIGHTPELQQEPHGIGHVDPIQQPLIRASELFTFTKRALSAEARELLNKVDEGGIPLLITQNLERIAKEHGIEVSEKMTPNDLVRRLRKLV
jgi:hypothetical protein